MKNPSSWPKLDQPTTTTIEKPTVENTEQSGKSCLINIYKKNIFITITRQVKCMNENKNEYSRYISLEINSKIKWRKQSTSYNTHHPCPCDPVLLFFCIEQKKNLEILIKEKTVTTIDLRFFSISFLHRKHADIQIVLMDF